jgi:hypothetical protein
MQPSRLFAAALSSTALVFALHLLPAVAAPAENTPVLPSEPAPPRIDATTQRWLDRLWQTADQVSDPAEKAYVWMRIVNLHTETYQDTQRSKEAIANAIAAAKTIADPADRVRTLQSILQSQLSAPAVADTLDLILKSIPAIGDPQTEDVLLGYTLFLINDLEPAVRLTAQPLALLEQIQDPYMRESSRSQITGAAVSQLVAQNQTAAAIDLIQQTPLLFVVPPEEQSTEVEYSTSDRSLKAKLDQLNSLTAILALNHHQITPSLPKLRTAAEAWIESIQDPYLKTQAEILWIGQLQQLGQEQEVSERTQALLQSLPSQPFSPPQKAKLLLPFFQDVWTWGNNPKLQPLSQQAIELFQTQLTAMGNAESVQQQKTELILDALYSPVHDAPRLLEAMTESANAITNVKLRSGLLYAIGFQYELSERSTEANAIYNQLLPNLDQLDDQTQAIAVLIKLGRNEEAIARAKANGESDILFNAALTFIQQQATAPALELTRHISDPISKALALAQISSILTSTGQPNALEPMQEALTLLQTLPEAEQVDAIASIGYFFDTSVPIQFLDPFSPTLQAGVLLGIVENHGWAESERNNQIAPHLIQLLPRLTQATQKNQVLSLLAYLDAADQPDRVNQWVDQMPPTHQAEALLRAIYLRSHLSTFPSPY